MNNGSNFLKCSSNKKINFIWISNYATKHCFPLIPSQLHVSDKKVLEIIVKIPFSCVGESESFQKFEDDLKEYLEHEFRLEDDIEDEDEEFALGPASSLSSKLPTKSQETKVGNLLKI